MNGTIKELISAHPLGTFKSLTVDNGKEFTNLEIIREEHKLPIYSADAYASYQRGSDENGNKIFRQFCPKKNWLCFNIKIASNWDWKSNQRQT